jgi:hypothetical protein
MLTKEDLKNLQNLIETTVYRIVRPMFKEQNEYIDRCFQNQAELIKQTYLPKVEFEKYRNNVKNAFMLADRQNNSIESKLKKKTSTTSGKIKE